MIYILLTWLFAPLWWLVAKLRALAVRTPQRILLVEIAGIGDVVCSTAVFRALRTQFESAHIALLVEPASVDIIANHPCINQVIAWPVRKLRGLTGRLALARAMLGFDTVICLNPGATQLIATCWAAVPRRMSVLPGGNKLSYQLLKPLLTAVSIHVDNQVFVQTQLNLLKPLGIDSQDCSKTLSISTDTAHKVAQLLVPGDLVGMAIGSGLALKEVPEEIQAATIAHLLAQPGTTVIFIGGTKEQERAARLSAKFPGRTILDLTGQLTLTESAAVLARLSLFIGVNSGITHMADALGIPIICLAGPSDVAEQGPNGPEVTILQRLPPCAPCDRVFSTPGHCLIGNRECITGISAQDIITAIDNRNLLRQQNPQLLK